MFPRRTRSFHIFLAALCVCGVAVAQDEDEDFPPGLLATFTAGDASIQRVDSTISFDWSGHAPDERLPPGPFTADWSGNLLARLPGTHRFHAFVAGDVTISVDGQTVLDASEQEDFASGNAFELSAGDHEFRVTYATSAAADKSRAKLAVFWSSDQFTLEPLPADVLFRDEGSPRISAQTRGHLLTDANRCAACHRDHNNGQSGDLSVLQAPALDQIKGSQDRSTLIQRLWRPQTVVANGHMPSFDLSPQEAQNVAEFLLSVSKDGHDEKAIKFKDGDADAGKMLLNSLGCVACHQLPGNKNPSSGSSNESRQRINATLSAPYDGPELINVAKRRTPAWLERWLRSPESLNVDHRMPVFELSNDERRQLVAALVDVPENDPEPEIRLESIQSKENAIAAGKQIVLEANCAACHRIPGIESKLFAPLAAASFGHPSGDCVNPADIPNLRSKPGQRVPSFYGIATASNTQQAAGSVTDEAAMTAYAQSRHAHSSLSPADQGQLLLNRNGCLACHDRDQSRGLSSIANQLQNAHPDLKGQSQGLVPPSLTAVGDKLNDDYLKKAVAGEQKEHRLPWLLVRMPKFAHSAADRAALVHHLISSDRIPDAADDVRQDVLAHVDLTGKSEATAEDLLLSNQLTGAAGFNCVACHKAGPFEPRNVALGTRGSDIMTMGARIRPRFFQRWMKNPIRVVAGIEMPAIKKAMPDVLDGSLPKQIGAMWKGLSDDRFTPPTVTSRFEQVVNVESGDVPRIIRDVFTIGTGKDRDAVARAMAIGFGNGHNILIDLDNMQVRLWTIGEFARQRTEGKSWYWDMPGTVVRQMPAQEFGFPLQTRSGRIIPAVEDEGRLAELLSYRLLTDGVEITCRSWFDTSDPPTVVAADAEPHFTTPAWANEARPLQTVTTKHTFTVNHKGSGTGWKRSVQVVDCPAAFRVVVEPAELQKDTQPSLINVLRNARGAKSPATTGQTVTGEMTTSVQVPLVRKAPEKPVVAASTDTITSTPGFTGTRLPIDMSIMPTAMTWLPDGRMAFTSLKGHVWIAEDTDADGLVDTTSLFEEGLSAPFGILPDGDSLIVSHKPEVLRLTDTDGDGKADLREVVAGGWGFNDNYHDWASGLIRDPQGNLYLGLGSDYSQKTRPLNQDRWRGGVIKIDPSGIVTPLGMSMRYPMGLAFDLNGNLFATDNQGVQNTFNEINHIQMGKHYGVPSAHQPTDGIQEESPAFMVPHPWTRSVNSILFLPLDFPVAELQGHGIGCEYDSRFLIRMTVQDVGGTLQGATYPFSLPNQEAGGSNFIGPICSAVGPDGALYIGSIWDSGWQGGQNTGGITRLVPSSEAPLPNGIREVTATPDGFNVGFFTPVDPTVATDSNSWSLQAYTREWSGNYASPDSGRHSPTVEKIKVAEDGKSIRIFVRDLQPGHVYDFSVAGELAERGQFWPGEAHYSMKVVPE